MKKYIIAICLSLFSTFVFSFTDSTVHLNGVTVRATRSASMPCGVDFVISSTNKDQHVVYVEYTYHGTFIISRGSGGMIPHLEQNSKRSDRFNAYMGTYSRDGTVTRRVAPPALVELDCRYVWDFNFTANARNTSQDIRDRDDEYKRKEQEEKDARQQKKEEEAKRKRDYQRVEQENARLVERNNREYSENFRKDKEQRERYHAERLEQHKNNEERKRINDENQKRAEAERQNEEMNRQGQAEMARINSQPCAEMRRLQQSGPPLRPIPASPPNAAEHARQVNAQISHRHAAVLAQATKLCGNTSAPTSSVQTQPQLQLQNQQQQQQQQQQQLQRLEFEKQQALQLKQQQDAQRLQAEQERRLAAQQRAREVLDAAIDRGKVTVNEAERNTQSIKNDNSNLMDMINKMK